VYVVEMILQVVGMPSNWWIDEKITGQLMI